MDNRVYRPLNLKILEKKESIIVSTQESLKDIEIITWNEDVLREKKQIIIDK